MVKKFLRLVVFGVFICHAVHGKSLKDVPKNINGAASKDESKGILF